jgi:hypothetical protein
MNDQNTPFSSEYDHASHPECITITRRALERCICNTIEKVMLDGGNITTIARDCMHALDAAAALKRE